MLLQVKGVIQIIVKFKAFLLHVFIMHRKYCRRAQKIMQKKQFCSNILKRSESNVYISPKIINWHVLQLGKADFRYTVFFRIFEKNYTKCTFLHHFCASMHQKSQQGIRKKLCFRISTSFRT